MTETERVQAIMRLDLYARTLVAMAARNAEIHRKLRACGITYTQWQLMGLHDEREAWLHANRRAFRDA